ncbi:hypothetical protein SRHO_G00302180 [Serrasalmus rhombeus]
MVTEGILAKCPHTSALDGHAERANEFIIFYNQFDCPVQISTAPASPAVTSTPSLFSAPGTSVSVCLDINTSSAPIDIHATLPDADGTDITTPSTPSSQIKASDLQHCYSPPSSPLHIFTADQDSAFLLVQFRGQELFVEDISMKVLGGVKISRRIKTPPNPAQHFIWRPTLHFFRLALSYRTGGQVEILTVSSSSDPCYSYTVLDEPWRATNFSDPANAKCDQSVSWVGWYRLMYQGQDIRMPESCVNLYMCGTNAPLWINGVHPQLQDGVVTLQICGHWDGDCCYFKSNPIRVKACSGNYYVYEFVSPSACWLTYCAEHLAGLKIRLSSAKDFKQSSTSEIFLKQLKEDLVRKGLPTNITLHLKSISKYHNVKPATLEPGTC